MRKITLFQSRKSAAARGARASRRRRWRSLEVLEDRRLLTAFNVTNLHASGPGSLRAAILSANHQPGADTIDFQVSGTIRTGRAPLPALQDTVTIDGTTAPSFAGTPVITLNFQGRRGLRFARGSEGSAVRSLALVRAGGAGVALIASNITVQGCDIGLLADGRSVAGNRGDGIRINASSHGDLIGQADPVSSVDSYPTQQVNGLPVTAWQGIREGATSGQYLVTGTSGTSGLLHEGPISGKGGTSYLVNVPGATASSVYGPNLLPNGGLQLVGTYRNGDGMVHGFLFQGTTADLSNAGDYQTIDYPGVNYTFVHSTMGGLAVGNGGDAPAATDHAFIYDISKGQFTSIVYPGANVTSTSAYGIWYNGGTSYTIAGGYDTAGSGAGGPVAQGFLVNYDAHSGQFSNWASFAGPSGLTGPSLVTHFEGISGVEKGVYTLSADTVDASSGTVVQASLASVPLNADGSFGPATWVNVNVKGALGLASANSVAGNQIVGIATSNSGTFAYQATVNVGFQLSNVISGNRGNGIGIYGASGNQVAMNFIGTDATGALKRGNGRNGIFVTARAHGNIIGGQATGGNDPTGHVIVRPPQGNLISGNRGDGVLINRGAFGNDLSGNFVGTNASGDAPLGNGGDGVAIVHANGNLLTGCTVQQDPFVFYNVISGNGRNGLRITNSNNTIVHANFLGAGADNSTIVPNRGDGLLVSGSSRNTQVGGVIPLGNVISGNRRNGIAVTDRASGFVSFNTFAGIFAFGGPAPNGRDGILITSRGGNNLIRTCIVSSNLRDGIGIGGRATGVQVTQTAVGTNTKINAAMPNLGDGVRIFGHAHGNAIGGFQPSIEPQVTISANRGYGIQVLGKAHGNFVYNTVLGTSALGGVALGNDMGGIELGPGTSGTTIGGPAAPMADLIVDNGGPGLLVRSSRDNTVLQTTIRDNVSSGIVAISARHNQIGSPGAGNTVLANGGFGLYARGNCQGTVVHGNQIAANAQGNVNLDRAHGIVYVP